MFAQGWPIPLRDTPHPLTLSFLQVTARGTNTDASLRRVFSKGLFWSLPPDIQSLVGYFFKTNRQPYWQVWTSDVQASWWPSRRAASKPVNRPWRT